MGPNFDDAVACELQFVWSADYNSAFSVYHQSMYPVMTLHVLTDIIIVASRQWWERQLFTLLVLHTTHQSTLFVIHLRSECVCFFCAFGDLWKNRKIKKWLIKLVKYSAIDSTASNFLESLIYPTVAERTLCCPGDLKQPGQYHV